MGYKGSPIPALKKSEEIYTLENKTMTRQYSLCSLNKISELSSDAHHQFPLNAQERHLEIVVNSLSFEILGT